jgi:hypothetical protein
MQNPDDDLSFLFGIILVAGLLISTIFYLLTLQKALQTVSRENRKMAPGLVWLLIIPFFRWVWNFFVANAIANSFDKEYKKYGLFQDKRPTYELGFSLAMLECCLIVPVFNVFALAAALVVWIIYWIKVNEHTNELLNVARNLKLKDRGKPTSI